MQPFLIHTVFNASIANSAAQNLSISSFNMPFFGDIALVGSAWVQTNTAGVQQVDMSITALSTPVPGGASPTTWRTQGGAGFGISPMPFFAYWQNVAASTVFPILGVQNGGGGISITVVQVDAIAYCSKS